MKEGLLVSKLCIPKIVCSGIKRQDLLERVHKMPEQIIVLHAGTGWGKTTLIASYVQTYQLPYGWYQIRRLDNDMNQFLCYFEKMIQSQMETFTLHQPPLQWSQETVEQIAKQILEQLERWEGTLNLILDDFQHIQNPLIFEFLSFFITHMGEGVRIFILIKGSFPGFLTRFVLQGIVGILGPQELRITQEELIEHLEEMKRDIEDTYAVEQVLHYTRGWPVAVRHWLLWSENVEGDSESLMACFMTSNFSDYLLYEIFQSLSIKQKRIMTESALLTVITPEACTYILETEVPKRFLDEFVKQQLLTERKHLNEYYYHPILRDFLQEQVEEGRKREIWKRAIQYYRKRKEEVQVLLYQDILEHELSGFDRRNNQKSDTEKSLSLICFGGMQIYDQVKGRTVHWRTKKTREMFAYFWEQKERSISKEEIMDVLWQEGNGQNLESLFHTTLSYLKRAFAEAGISNLIQMKNKKYVMNTQCFTSDVQKLLHLRDVWKIEAESLDLEQAFLELTEIYQGDYMEELDGSWVIVSREYYQGIFLKNCEFLVEQASYLHDYDLAIRILEQAMKVDPYSERLNGMLLTSLGEKGEFKLAQQQYERYLKLMKEELNVEIGRQVQEIYQNVMLRRIG